MHYESHSCSIFQELGLRDLGINVLSLTSLSPKEVQSEVYRSIDSDASLKLLYGELYPQALGSFY